MKAYVTTTGVLFALLVVLHVWRAFAEGGSEFKSPIYIASTVACAALAIWAWRVRSKIP